MKGKFVVIGISDARNPFFPPNVLAAIQHGQLFSGGRRHHEIVASLLPKNAIWIDIVTPLTDVFQHYAAFFAEQNATIQGAEQPYVVVFASGDPLFFGFANTLRREMPDAEITVYPAFNSLQLLAHQLVLPYHDMHIVSLTGRPWQALDEALIRQCPKIGVLTDGQHNPTTIARRLLDYGYRYYRMAVGERLGNEESQRVSLLTLDEAAERTFARPNCVLLMQNGTPPKRPLGIPDSAFELLDGREKMITKAPIRLLTLAALELQNRQLLWDVGFCTGSVSIEARLAFPHLHVTAFEVRPECERLMRVNAHRFGALGITTVIGNFLKIEPPEETPDAVFMGGHGGQLAGMMRKAIGCMARGGVLVYNCVDPTAVSDPRIRPDSQRIFYETAQQLGCTCEEPLRVAVNNHHPIYILKVRKI